MEEPKGLGQLRQTISHHDTTTSPSDSDVEQDETIAIYLVVEWLSPERPLAISGDSGSLVFALSDNIMIPLGIHIKSSGNKILILNLRILKEFMLQNNFKKVCYSLFSWSSEIASALGANL